MTPWSKNYEHNEEHEELQSAIEEDTILVNDAKEGEEGVNDKQDKKERHMSEDTADVNKY